MAKNVDVRVVLSEETARRLHEVAQRRGVPEATIIEQALDLLFEGSETSPQAEYWLSVATMRDDWDAMPDDWMADKVDNGSTSR